MLSHSLSSYEEVKSMTIQAEMIIKITLLLSFVFVCQLFIKIKETGCKTFDTYIFLIILTLNTFYLHLNDF